MLLKDIAVQATVLDKSPMPRASDPSLLRAFGARIRVLRQARGWTQEQLAEAVELLPPAISRIEGGHLGVTLTSASQFAAALAVPMSDLFTTVPAAHEEEMLDGEERALVATWRALRDDDRAMLRAVVKWVTTRTG